MSEAIEKVSGIRHLPLFPLPLVLLPNEFLPLHIFEPRYRQLLKDVGLSKNMFGVSFFNPVDTFVEKPAAGTIGCVAEVRKTQAVPDGRSNILTVGIVRYRLTDYIEAGEPYLVGDVEFFEDSHEDETVLNPLANEVHTLFKRIALAAHKLSGERSALPEIPQAAPEMLSFLITAAFNLETEVKYRMLETRSTIERLTKMREILRQAVGKMEANAEITKIASTNGHGKKKIEI
jgi:Lon protease-like protein